MEYLGIFSLTMIAVATVDVAGTLFYRKKISASSNKIKAQVESKSHYSRIIHSDAYSPEPITKEEWFINFRLENNKFVNIEVSRRQFEELTKGSSVELTHEIKQLIKKRLYLHSLYLRQSMFYSSQEETFNL